MDVSKINKIVKIVGVIINTGPRVGAIQTQQSLGRNEGSHLRVTCLGDSPTARLDHNGRRNIRWSAARLPDATRINRVLAKNSAGYETRVPNLVATHSHTPIPVPERPPSLDTQAHALIENALNASDRALDEGQGRQAVQEVLWLLETISTAFRGTNTSDGSIQGRYFNKIIGELRLNSRGSHQEQILAWMMALHGFLSSPTGGGIRHGVDLAEGVAVELDEARLYCNLIRSYITFLIAEHERATGR